MLKKDISKFKNSKSDTKQTFLKSISMMLFMLSVSLIMASCTMPTKDKNQFPDQSTQSLSAKKKNVVFILVDDLGYSDIGAYNTKTFYETPNIDALASQGVQFTNGYAASPVCSPTRAAIMTGKHPTRIAATDWFHRPEWPHNAERFQAATMNEFMDTSEHTLAESFKAKGYKTAFLGKWHLGQHESYWPEHQGFDVNIAGHDMGQPPRGYFSPYKNPRLEDGPDGEYLTERLTTEAINLIDDYKNQDNPFLLYLSFYSVHTPLQAPPETVAKYTAKGAGFRHDEKDFSEEPQYMLKDEKRMVRSKQNHAIYGAMVEHMDRNVGRVLDKLKVEGLIDDTIIVFTSDNGGLSSSEGSPTSNLPLRGGKGWLYEGGIRVPLIVAAPNQSANGTKSETQIMSTDFYPTLLDLNGMKTEPEHHQDGASFKFALNGDVGELTRPLFFHYPHYSNQGGFPGAAVRKGNYKLLQNFEDGSLQLYNLSTDIGEQHDIKIENPEKLSELKTLLLNWYDEMDARFLRPLDAEKAVVPWSPGRQEYEAQGQAPRQHQ